MAVVTVVIDDVVGSEDGRPVVPRGIASPEDRRF